MDRMDNLIPLGERDPEEAFKIRSLGGIASRDVRNRKRKLKEELILLLEKGDTQKKISLSMIQQALDGNVKAFEVIRDTIGEKPVDKIENKVDFNDGKLDDVLKAVK